MLQSNAQNNIRVRTTFPKRVHSCSILAANGVKKGEFMCVSRAMTLAPFVPSKKNEFLNEIGKIHLRMPLTDLRTRNCFNDLQMAKQIWR